MKGAAPPGVMIRVEALFCFLVTCLYLLTPATETIKYKRSRYRTTFMAPFCVLRAFVLHLLSVFVLDFIMFSLSWIPVAINHFLICFTESSIFRFCFRSLFSFFL